MTTKRIDEGRAFIDKQVEAMNAKLYSNQVELSQYISFVELCTKAHAVLNELEAIACIEESK